MIACAEASEFLFDYVEGDLDAESRGIFEGHLRHCPPCQTYLDSYRRTIALGRSSRSSSVEPMPEDLLVAILETRRRMS